MCTPQKAQEFFDVAKDKALNDPDENLKPLYWDIVVLLAPWLALENLQTLFTEALELTKGSNANLQKKGWRILEQIGATENENCGILMREKESEIMDGMMSSLGTCAASARKPRLQLLEQILPKMSHENLKPITSELVLCTKDKNAISRNLSYTLLSAICGIFEEKDEENSSILEFIQLLLVGLNGSPLTVACTLNVITRIMYEYREAIPTQVHSMILENVLLLMNSAAREILKATVSFLISLTKVLKKDELAPHIEVIVTAIVNWKPETRNPFRMKVRRLLERLVKKFGFDLVQKFVPEKSPISKVLANAKKIRARNERQRAERQGQDDSDDENDEIEGPAETLEDLIQDSDDEEEPERKQKKKSKNKFKTQIQEDGEGVLDMLSPSAVQALTATGGKKRKEKVQKMDMDDDEIGTAPDGRLMIREKSKKIDQDMLSSDEEDGIPENIRMSDQKLALQRSRDEDSGKGKKQRSAQSETASIYKAKKAGGDVKRKGKADPYSYLPLRKDMLNKRNKKKGNVPGLANIVRGAKRGAQKGRKNRKPKST